MYVLDTHVVSALMKGDETVIQRLQQASRDSVLIPQPVLAEIAYGLERLPVSARRMRLEQRFELIRQQIGRAIWNDDVSHQFGSIKAVLERRSSRIEDFDIAISAHALAVGGVLVTANRKHMLRISGLEIQNWGTL